MLILSDAFLLSLYLQQVYVNGDIVITSPLNFIFHYADFFLSGLSKKPLTSQEIYRHFWKSTFLWLQK